jgi:AraC-like DNA-binding protein
MYVTQRQHVVGGADTASVINRVRSYETGWHAHDEYMILLPRSGGVVVRTEIDKTIYRLNASCLTLIAPGVHHATAATRADQQHLALYVDPAYVDRCRGPIEKARPAAALAKVGVWRISPALVSMLRLRDELLAGFDESLHQPQLEAMDRMLATECITTALTMPNVLPSVRIRDSLLIHEVQAYVEAHLAEHLSLDDVAAQFLLSRRHLTRMFRERTGNSLLEFINRRRIERAHVLLADPATTILEASLAVGIDSPSYFAKLYRRVYGHAPSQRR